MANPNPSPGTRFKLGASANPGGKPKPKPQPPDPAPDRAPEGSPDPRGILERTVAKLTAIMDDPEAETGHQLMAIRLLIGEDLASTIRYVEHDHDEDARRQERIQTAVGLVLEHYPDIGAEPARAFVARCLEAMEPTNLTDTLRDRLGLWQSEPLTDETLTQIWHELGLPGNPGPEPEPPRPCGFRELPPPAPAPDPDREFLAAQAVERERERRERIKHPGQVPPAAPPAPSESCGVDREACSDPDDSRPTPHASRPTPDPPAPEPDRPFLSFPGFDFYPDLGD